MHGERVDAVRVQLVLLVLHERDERADDDRQAGEQERGKLVDDRLPAAGRHDDERVATVEQRLDRFPLAGAEIGMAEALAQQRPRLPVEGFVAGRHRRRRGIG